MLPADDTEWLALIMWDEARNQIRDGQAAVGRVVKNRATLKYQSDGTIQGSIMKPLQFSGLWFDMVAGKYQRVALTMNQALDRASTKFATAQAQHDLWASLKNIATAVLSGDYVGDDYHQLTDRTVLYANLDISHPIWALPANFVVKIGAHSFFTDPNVPAPAAQPSSFGQAATQQALGG